MCKGATGGLDVRARKDLTEKVTHGQRLEGSEVSHIDIRGMFQAEGTADAKVRGRICSSPSLTLELEAGWEVGPSCWPSFSS